ncbi:MAG: hypothetical protein RL650_1100 [Pseudomonadota bacterium]|jgi:hypothetical protein
MLQVQISDEKFIFLFDPCLNHRVYSDIVQLYIHDAGHSQRK